MNNIYVDELPKKCAECLFIGHYEKGCFSRNPHCCCELHWWLNDDDFKVDKNTRSENCPLKPLSDRLAEERKKVVQKIREPIIKSLENGVVRNDPKSSNRNLRDIILFQVLDILDQVEKGE